MDILYNISMTFWSPNVWLPPNTTWDDVKPTPENQLTHSHHLLYPLILGVVLLGLRYILERYCFAPFGTYLGIKTIKIKQAQPNDLLEKAYVSRKIQHKQILALAKQLDWSEVQVQHWLRLRHSRDKPTTLKKFCETSWRCTYYTSAFIYGIIIMWDKPWLWDIKFCYYDYPFHALTNDIWWYYMVSMGFYWSLSFSQFFDVKRKDFWQMFIHHIAAIVLMCLSWVGNLTRIGSLVLLIHDCADPILEIAKMAKYAGYQKVFDHFFLILTILWIVTRIGIYPFWIIYSTSVTAPTIVPMFPAYYIFNSLLILLFALHLMWTWFILRIAYSAFQVGEVIRDIRSDSSDVSDDYCNNTSENNVHEYSSKENSKQKTL